ncbi:DNA topoisomerase IV [Hyunsoonleella pacifica]|uniref:DNA topoisomerase IV n=1 Tax=Hyunsoonleella pacifica TaxID=1080224 RepID=A0A4Q9FQN6_9FLAO|nr:DNA topoisomerase IV [Hyunsoonleella pacifica]TBN17644.1 DNA topoisomerase IV [Hyunsoonleella pacifica]GGD10201.1 hypothetical protein GCM10011368_10190 [Hyunsoonleella pacifica]
MKNTLLCLALILLTSCYKTERNCKNYRTGKFYSESIVNGIVYKSYFVRTEQLQIETYDNHTDSSEIRWINDCEAVFRTINPKNMSEQKDIHLKILKTTDSSYSFEYSYVGEVKKAKGIAYKIE